MAEKDKCLLLIYFTLISALATAHIGYGRKEIGSIVCFYNNEASLRAYTAKLHVRDVDVTKCTHLVYMAAKFEINAAESNVDVVGTLTQVDIQQNGFSDAIDFQERWPKLRVYVMVDISDDFDNYMLNQSQYTNYVQKILEFLQVHGFDGYFLNFKDTTTVLQNPQSLNFYSALESTLTEKNFSLSAVVPANNASSVHQSWIQFLNGLQFVGISTFDMHHFQPTQNYVNSHSPLYGKPNANDCRHVACSVNVWLAKELNSDRLLIGIATHGVSFTLANPKNNALNATAIDAGTPGAYLRKKGIRAHYEICSSLKSDSWSERLDAIGRVPFAVSGRQWVGYENSKSIQEKMKFVKENHLSGVFVWTLDTDDFMGMCGEKWVLTSAVNQSTSAPASNQSADESYNCTSEGLFADHRNCHKFIQCTRGLVFHRMDCPAGLHFNPKQLMCDWPQLANCTTQQDDVEEVAEDIRFHCFNRTGLYQDPKNCSGFYWCAQGLNIGLSHCPHGLHFNDNLKVCDWPTNVQCTYLPPQ